MRRAGHGLAVVLVASVLAGCTGSGGPVLANPTLALPAPAGPTAGPSPAADPIPIVLPRDDRPHDRLTEWWYYTGHLTDAAGGHWGFEFVVFRAERGAFPVSWASHLALTDESGRRFLYSQRSEIGPQVDQSPRASDGSPTGFGLAIGDAAGPTGNVASGAGGLPGGSSTMWTMAGSGGHDVLDATFPASEASGAGSGGAGTGNRPSGIATASGASGIHLTLVTTKPPVLHGRAGWIEFGPAGGSYYYSRTRMTATGTVTIGGRTLQATGIAWFDHQWGDFIAVGGGGWDWFAINLDDGTDLTLSLIRNLDGSYPLVDGTLVGADGRTTHLDRSAFDVAVSRHWTSPATGADYPAGWRVTIPSAGLVINLRPTVADQELDTRATTGVVYWEGSQVVDAIHNGRPLGGSAYVELTGYAPAPTTGPAAP